MPTPAEIEALIDAHAKEVAAFHGLQEDKSTTLPPRQILVAQAATYFSAGFVAATGSPPDTQAYILLTGTPTTSSEVTRGYLRFVPRDQVKAPRYSATSKTINVWLDIASLPQTLEQVRHANRYLWIGWFAGGHVYSDLHTSD